MTGTVPYFRRRTKSLNRNSAQCGPFFCCEHAKLVHTSSRDLKERASSLSGTPGSVYTKAQTWSTVQSTGLDGEVGGLPPRSAVSGPASSSACRHHLVVMGMGGSSSSSDCNGHQPVFCRISPGNTFVVNLRAFHKFQWTRQAYGLTCGRKHSPEPPTSLLGLRPRLRSFPRCQRPIRVAFSVLMRLVSLTLNLRRVEHVGLQKAASLTHPFLNPFTPDRKKQLKLGSWLTSSDQLHTQHGLTSSSYILLKYK